MEYRTEQQLCDDLLAIWNAALDGVRVEPLMRNAVALHNEPRGGCLVFGEQTESLESFERIVVLGGGKASGAMAQTLETILEPLAADKQILGWVNVPEDCVKRLKYIHLHAARPAGVNEPTEEGVAGTNEILRLAEELTDTDLCVCLLSGGGSALLPAPLDGITLHDKQEVTRFLSESGASIQELNTVRKQISRIKGGGLKRLCSGKRLICLILSDVMGDPLDIIASGPTVDNSSSPQDALDILLRFAPDLNDAQESGLPRRAALRRVMQRIEQKASPECSAQQASPECSAQKASGECSVQKASGECSAQKASPECSAQKASGECNAAKLGGQASGGYIRNIVIGNNAMAVNAAGEEAQRRGYTPAMYVSKEGSATAEETGLFLAKTAIEMQHSGPDALIHGGEPVVQLAPADIRGKGGRNQQLVLAALDYLLKQPGVDAAQELGIAFLSGGTDGEDGPTDAAGAMFTPPILRRIIEAKRQAHHFDLDDYLRRNDAYRFFERYDALLKTGATGTNVCDVRIVLVSRMPDETEK